MHSNEFEREVQQKTEGLKITPSEGLWDKIEGKLPPEKKRRRPLLWMLLALLLAGGGAATWFFGREADKALDKPVAQTEQQQPVATESIPTLPVSENNQSLAKKDAPPLATNPASGQPQATGATALQDSTAMRQQVDKSSQAGQAPTGTISPDSTLMLGNANNGATKKNRGADNQNIIAKKQKKASRLLLAATSKAVQVNMTVGQPDTMGLVPYLVADNAITPLAAPLFATIPASPATAQLSLRPIKAVPIEVLTAPLHAAAPTSKTKKRWEWGISVGTGISNRSDLFLFALSSRMELNFFSPGGVPQSITTLANAETKPGITYSAGLYLQKQIGKRWHLQTGLSYDYLSFKQTVGSLVQDSFQRLIFGFSSLSSVGSFDEKSIEYSTFFRSGNSSVYTNRIHLLQLPIELQYRFGKRYKWGVHGGAAIGYAIQQNMLVYDPINANYFSNSKAYNRTQLSIRTGVAVYPKPNTSLAVGLRINYNVTSLVKRQIETQQVLSGLLYCNIPLKKK